MKKLVLLGFLFLGGRVSGQDLQIVMISPANAVIKIDGKPVTLKETIYYSKTAVISCADQEASCAAIHPGNYHPVIIWPRSEQKKEKNSTLFSYVMSTLEPELTIHNVGGKLAPVRDYSREFREKISATLNGVFDKTPRPQIILPDNVDFMYQANRFLIIDSINIKGPLGVRTDADHFFYLKVDSAGTHYSKRIVMNGDSLHFGRSFYYLSSKDPGVVTVMYANGADEQHDRTYNTFRPVFLKGDQLLANVGDLLRPVAAADEDFKVYLVYNYLMKNYDGVADLDNIRVWLLRNHL